MAKSTDNKKSRYVQGGETEEFQKRLGIWDRKTIPYRDDDITHVVSNEEAGRPDLISYNVYGTPDLMWLVLQFNNILDPTLELDVDTELRLPTPERVLLAIVTR